MKKERWDNRMSLWTRLFYGVPDMETWYQQNPTHQDTIRYYTAITYNDDLPARYDTYKRSKEYITKYYSTRVLPEMTYEQIIAIIDSLNTIRLTLETSTEKMLEPTHTLSYWRSHHWKED